MATEAAESFFIEALFKAKEQIKCFWVVNQSTRLHPSNLLCKYWLIDNGHKAVLLLAYLKMLNTSRQAAVWQ